MFFYPIFLLSVFWDLDLLASQESLGFLAVFNYLGIIQAKNKDNVTPLIQK